MIPMLNLMHEQTELKTEWLLLQRCNLSNIGDHVYVTVRVRVRIRVMVSVRGYLCLQCFDAVGWAAGRASGL